MSLLILLPVTAAGTDATYEHVVSPDGRSPSAHADVPLALLPTGDCTVVVPVAATGWHAVELPPGLPRNSPRLRAALHGLLEERLLDEPEAVHLAVSQQANPDGRHWVATCSGEWLKSHIQALELSGRRVTRMVPEFDPDDPLGRLHVCGTPQRPWLVAAGKSCPGGAARVPLVPGALLLLTGRDQVDDSLVVSAEPALTELAEQALQHRVDPLQPAVRLLEAGRSAWDLAQFDLAASGPTRWLRTLARQAAEWRTAPRWRPARWGLLALVLAQLVGLNAWAWRERSEISARRQSLGETLTRTFPSVRLVVDAPVQMAREVSALRRATGAVSGADLEPALAALGSALPEGRNISAIDFDGRALRVQGLSGEDLPEIQSRLASRGYGATFEGDRLVVRHEGTP